MRWCHHGHHRQGPLSAWVIYLSAINSWVVMTTMIGLISFDCKNAERSGKREVFTEMLGDWVLFFLCFWCYTLSFYIFFSVFLYPGLLYHHHPPSPPRVPVKDIHKRSTAYGRDSGGPAWTPALPSLAASTRQSLFCRSLVLIGLGWRRVHSFSQIGFVYCAFHVMCVLKHNLTAVAFLPFSKITLERKTAEKNMIWFLFSSWELLLVYKCANQKWIW